MASKDLLKPTAIALGCAAAAIAAPALAPYLATISLPFFGTVLAKLFSPDAFNESLGRIVVDTATSFLTNVGSSAVQEIPGTLKRDHNYHLERLVATAYLEAIAEVESTVAVGIDNELKAQAREVIPRIKLRLESALSEKDLGVLFPVISADFIKKSKFANLHSAETIGLMVADDEKWRVGLGDITEVALQRWLNEAYGADERARKRTVLGIPDDRPLPSPLLSVLRKELPPRVARRISELVKRRDFKKSWIAFQRAHLQGILRVLNSIEAKQDDLKDEIAHLGGRLEEILDSDALVKSLASKLEVFFGSISLRAPEMEHLLERQSADLLLSISSLLDQKLQEFGTKIVEQIRENVHGVSRETFKADVSHFDVFKYAPAELVGRAAEFQVLDDAWNRVESEASRRPHIVTFVALGGEGKTSLVAKWVASLAHRSWPRCEAVYAWSFYSQGTREQSAVSSDMFLTKALEFFGDPAAASGATSLFDKGRRLAQILGAMRALLVLDGVEPLQYSLVSPMPGQLRDQGLISLLRGLAVANRGLCVITTRYAMPDLQAWNRTTAPSYDLPRLPTAAAVELLKTTGVKTGSLTEFEALVEKVEGHALTLQIVGQFLVRAFHGDIRRYRLIDFRKADSTVQAGHAFRAMDAYVKWMKNGSNEARRQLAILSLVGLFDRPATQSCILALRNAPAIRGLTEPIVGLADDDWEVSLTALKDAKLITISREDTGRLLSVDAHPLVREYFGRLLRDKKPKTWRAAHERLFRQLCDNAPFATEPTLDDLEPLYQAVVHGCYAGMQREACQHVLCVRIFKGDEAYSLKKLGAYAPDLGALSCFFETPWRQVSSALQPPWQTWLLGEAAFRLRGLGRIQEALEPARTAFERRVKEGFWKSAAILGSNLSEMELRLGDIRAAVRSAEQSVTYADRALDDFERMARRTSLAEALYQQGRFAESETSFSEAEKIQSERQPDRPLLYSVFGFRYCDFLLRNVERAAWQRTLEPTDAVHGSAQPKNHTPTGQERKRIFTSLRASTVVELLLAKGRAKMGMEIVLDGSRNLADIARFNLSLGIIGLFDVLLKGDSVRGVEGRLDQAVQGFRQAGEFDELPRALLGRAWFRNLQGAATGPDSAESDLTEAWEIGSRSGMRLVLADIHLYRARLFAGETPYPWKSAAADFQAAREIIKTWGYHRRDNELSDAQLVILGQSKSQTP